MKKNIVLGSASPRRKALIEGLGLPYFIRTKYVDEVYPSETNVKDVALYLAELKAEPLLVDLKKDEILITADTTVVHNHQILNKPSSKEEAKRILKSLSNDKHQVITGVSIVSKEKKHLFSTHTNVFFKPLSINEIEYYIDHYKPYDKAGAYGIQEWIGQIGISHIEGCYYNVMGLPISKVWEALKKF